MTNRVHSAWAWIVGILLALVLYVLSIGPACWWFLDTVIDAPWIYFPIGRVARFSGKHGISYRAISWYVTFGTREAVLPADPDASPVGEFAFYSDQWVLFRR